MTDSLHPDDTLLSAWLDQELEADERAALEARLDEPAVAARLAALRAARELVAAPVRIPTRALDEARAAALAESLASPAVTELAAARHRRGLPRALVAAAAAVVVVALAVPIVSRLGGGSGDETADASFAGADAETGDTNDADGAASVTDGALAPLDAAESASSDLAADDVARDNGAGDAGDSGVAGDTADAAPLDTTEFTAGGALGGDLGDHPSAAALGATVQARLAAQASTTTTAGETAPVTPASTDPTAALLDAGLDGCPGAFDEVLAAAQDNGLRRVEVATATITGRPVVVLVASPPDPALRLLVDLGTCAVTPLPLG